MWVNTLLEKHAWLSAGLVWMQGASQSADTGVYRDVLPEAPEARPAISLFEHWEEGAHLPVALNARDYALPSSLVVPYYWTQAPQALSLYDAINSVSTHGEKHSKEHPVQLPLSHLQLVSCPPVCQHLADIY